MADETSQVKYSEYLLVALIAVWSNLWEDRAELVCYLNVPVTAQFLQY